MYEQLTMHGDDDHLQLLDPLPLVVAVVGPGVRVCLGQVPGEPQHRVEDHLRVVRVRLLVDGVLLLVGHIHIRHARSEILRWCQLRTQMVSVCCL